MEIYESERDIDRGNFLVFEDGAGNYFMFQASCCCCGSSQVISDNANITFVGDFTSDEIKEKFPKFFNQWLWGNPEGRQEK